ncbi:maleylacetoacetate isomerase-like protein [Lichtheimia hyalospora FSU 10163]|nr:maleylacetoacetate isomerase-like protein [Lichtheimia hyalospora FSU 10163]
MSSNEKPILYGYFRSGTSWRARTILAWKGIEYENRFVDLAQLKNNDEDYIKVNPSRRVPTYITPDGRTLTQSMAILEYIEETHPERPLYPKDPFQRAQVRELCNEVACDIHPIQNNSVQAYVAGKDMTKREEWARHFIARGFEGIEKRLEKEAGKFAYGDEITMADVVLVPQYYNALRFKLDMSRFPTIERVCKNAMAVPEFIQSSPQQQPDCPADFKQ